MSLITFLFFICQALLLVPKSYQYCYEFSAPEHGRINFGPHNSYYQIACDPGYFIQGQSTVYCSGYDWENPVSATCVKSTFCPLPPPLKHGTVMDCSPTNMPRHSKKCTFRCTDGYELLGPSYMICRSNGKLTDENGEENFPKCVASALSSIQAYSDGKQGVEDPIPSKRRRNHFQYGEPLLREPQDDPCKNRGGCDHVCKNDKGLPRCRCNSGFTLAEDQRSCIALCLPGCSHGYCEQPNECICESGWVGEFCDTCVKHPGCQHDTCTEPRQCNCNEGWEGQFCNKALCLPGCVHGDCKHPNECICEMGWVGEFCDICEKYPSCQHGTCTEPWQCNCDKGWDGFLCDQALCLPRCVHGDCEQPNECKCEPGWVGELCDTCVKHPNCQHGTCIERWQCICDEGWGGPFCDQEKKHPDPDLVKSFQTTNVQNPHEVGLNGFNRNHPCFNHPCQQYCRVENGRAQCRCKAGYKLNIDEKTCRVHKPCKINKWNCSHICNDNGNGTATCGCPSGLILGKDGKRCIKVVSTNAHCRACSHICKNEGNGKVSCACPTGLILDSDRKTCIDIDECKQSDLNHCQHFCHNTKGSYMCSCREGYTLTDDYNCEDVDECSSEYLNDCQHNCINIDGSYECSCEAGYILIGRHKCEGCRKNMYWSYNLQGCLDCPKYSRTHSEGKLSIKDCICEPGYEGMPGEHIACEDINECLINNFGCSYKCINIPGSAYCICPDGFKLDADNKTCVDVDECSIKNGGCEGTCHNSEGSFSCSCDKGFTLSQDRYSCDDIDECLEDKGGCEHKCNNYRGGFYCSCKPAYHLDNDLKTCIAGHCPGLPLPRYTTMVCKRQHNPLPKMDNYPHGTNCMFTCQEGYKNTEDSNRVKCLRNGTWSGSLPKCRPQHCHPLEVPENGVVHPSNCSKHDMEVNRRCTFTCRMGYELEGQRVFSCQTDLKWNHGDIPVCKPVKLEPVIRCPEDIRVTLLPGQATHNISVPKPRTNMNNYEVHPAWVSVDKLTEFGAGITDITFTAISDVSNKTATCITTVIVLDEEPPVFEFCPDPISIENVDPTGQLVTWEEPVVTDNVQVASVFSILRPNMTFTPGTYFVEYVAKDSSGNIETCSFGITVMGINCSNLKDPEHGQANCSDWLFGTLCSPECKSGYMRDPDEPEYYSCSDSGVWEPSDTISECLRFSHAISSTCEDGFEFKTILETEENVCIECSSNTVWSPTTKKCEKTTT